MDKKYGIHAVGTLVIFASAWLIVLICLAVYASTSKDVSGVLSGGIVVAIGTLAIGVLLGLLFGAPRTGDKPTTEKTVWGLVPNAAFDQVMDWVTKILVGLGLTQIFEASTRLQQLGDYLAPVFGGSPTSARFAVGVVLSSVVVGFLGGFVWGKLILSTDLVEAFKDEFITKEVDSKIDQKANADASITPQQVVKAKQLAQRTSHLSTADMEKLLNLSHVNLDEAGFAERADKFLNLAK